MSTARAWVATGGQRHEAIANVAAALDTIIVGQAAAFAMKDPRVDAALGVARLPQFFFGESAIPLGRKDQPDHGFGRLLMPLRLDWQPGPVVLVGASGQRLSWSLHGLGHRGAGDLRLYSIPPDERPPVGAVDFSAQGGGTLRDGLPGPAGYVRQSPLTVRRTLLSLQQQGEVARWELVTSLEDHIAGAVARACAGLAREFGTSSVLDPVGQAEVTNTILYGHGQQDSAVFRLVKRMCAPRTFDRVDPSRYMRTELNRTAWEAVRRKLGDPKLGARVRAVFLEHQPSSMQALLEKYAELYPEDMLGPARALAALSAGADVMSQQVRLRDEDPRS